MLTFDSLEGFLIPYFLPWFCMGVLKYIFLYNNTYKFAIFYYNMAKEQTIGQALLACGFYIYPSKDGVYHFPRGLKPEQIFGFPSFFYRFNPRSAPPDGMWKGKCQTIVIYQPDRIFPVRTIAETYFDKAGKLYELTEENFMESGLLKRLFGSKIKKVDLRLKTPASHDRFLMIMRASRQG